MKNFKTFMMKRKREDYLPPDYYIKLLKTYSFSGITDIEIFDKLSEQKKSYPIKDELPLEYVKINEHKKYLEK